MKKTQILAGLKTGSASVVLGMALVAAPGFAQTNSTQPEATGQQSTNPADTQNVAPAGPAEQVPNPANANGDTSQSNASQGGDIVVTGSRIPQPNLTAVSPVTVVNNAEFKLSGTTRTEDLLNTLPQVFADQGSSVSNGATGTATINLRDLGAKRTLVLINGRRLVPGDPSDSAADVNFIPPTLIKRVDVLTGGASSTYGADAVGGVVNFIMDTDFTGVKLDSQYSFYQHDNRVNSVIRNALNARGFGFPDGHVADGGTVDATAVVGASFDDNRGHVVAYAGYRKIQAVTQANRDYSACSISADQRGRVTCGGSATSANGTVFAFAGGSPDDIYTDPNTGIKRPVPYSAGTSSTFQPRNGQLVPGATLYNFGPTNYFQRPDERYTAGFFAHYDVDPAFKPYLEGMFMDDRSVAQIAPSGDFGNTFTINCDNPLLSSQQKSILCDYGNLVTASIVPGTGPGTNLPLQTTAPPSSTGGAPTTVTSAAQNGIILAPYTFIDPTTGQQYQRGAANILKRNVEGAPRRDDLQHTSYRIVAGAKGDINSAFSYDAYYQYGRTNFAETYFNDFSIQRLGRALDVVADANGNPVCRSARDGTDTNCVPYDIFTGKGVSQASVNYLAVPGFQRAQVSEQVASVNVTGLLGKYGIQTPWANDGVGINVGAEYRREQLNFNSDLEFQTGDLAGQGAATLPVQGAFNVYEGFGELRVPIVQQNFVYDLSFEGGYRYSHYEVGNRTFNTNTYKLGGEFAPIRSIRFRGAYNRAVRAPNIQEFFAPQRVALDGSNDPCAKTITAADTGCIAQGLRVNQTVVANPAGQYNGLIGGNPDLTPEKADTFTVGAVLQPDFVPVLRGLAITVDYFNIKVKNLVSTIGEDVILQACTDNAASPFCALIHRDGSGSLWRSPQGFVTDTTQNIGSQRTSGIDVGGSYAHDIGGLGSLSFNYNGTFLDEFKVNNGVTTPYDCKGLYGAVCGTPLPKYRHKARLTFTLPDGIGISGQWRYFGAVHGDASSSNDTLNGPISPFDTRIGAQSFFDLSINATVAEHYTFRFGVQNLLDRQPPLVSQGSTSRDTTIKATNECPAGFCNGNTYPVVYDALGRYIYAGVSLNF